MSFWINDRKGVAFEDTFDPDPEYSGECRLLWNTADNDFTTVLPRDEEWDVARGARRVSESEAIAFAKSSIKDSHTLP